MNKGKGSSTRRRFGRMLVSYGIVFFIGLWVGYKVASTGKTVAPEMKEMPESATKVGKEEQGNGEGSEGNSGASETSSSEKEVVQKDDLTFYETLLKKESSREMQGERKGSKGTPAAPGRKERKSPSNEGTLSKRTLPGDVSFFIQVGSFAHKKQAEDLIRRLQEKGYPAYITSQIISGMGRMYRVRIGGYPTLEEAKREAKIIERKEKLQTLVPSSPDR